MGRIKSIKYIGKKPVYNMYVPDLHNFLIQGNVVSHNCDSLRYFCIYWTVGAEKPKEEKKRKWHPSQWEDYYNASPTDQAKLIEMWGEPDV